MSRKRGPTRTRRSAAPRKPMPRKPPKVEDPATVYRRRPKHRPPTLDEAGDR